MTIGQQINYERTRRHWSITTLARESGLTRDQVTRVENGGAVWLKLPRLKALCDALELDIIQVIKTALENQNG